MRILSFVGHSGSGKTTLIERLIPHLPVEAGRIAILKQSHHTLDWHPREKDSTRFWDTGVVAVGVADPVQYASFQMRRGRLGQPSEERSSQPATQLSLAAADSDQTRDLAELCRLLPNLVELVLAEGFSEALFAKLWLTHDPPERGPFSPPVGTRAIIATPTHAESWRHHVPHLPVHIRDDIDSIAAAVWGWGTDWDRA